MRIVIKETVWSFKKNLKFNVLLILQLSIYFWLICMLINTFFDMGFKNYYKDFIVNDKIYYQLSFFKGPVLWGELLSNDSEAENINNFIKELKDQEDYIYTKYTSSSDLTLKKYKLKEKGISLEKLNDFASIDNSDPNLINLKSTQMDKNGFEYFDFEMYKGRLFNKNDYILKSTSDKLSIILGNDYKEIFNIGDEIEFEYEGKLFIGTIIGILKEDSKIYNSNIHSTNLNNQIILPLVDLGYVPINEVDKLFRANIYTTILTGANVIADVDTDNIKITKTINELCNRFGVMRYEPSLTSSTNGMDLFINESDQVRKIMFVMILLITFLSIFSFVINIYNKIEKNSRRYLIHILQGASIGNILFSYLLEVFIIILSSLGISSYLLRNEISISYKFLLLLLLIEIIVSIIVCSAIAYRLNNLSSDKILRRE